MDKEISFTEFKNVFGDEPKIVIMSWSDFTDSYTHDTPVVRDKKSAPTIIGGPTTGEVVSVGDTHRYRPGTQQLLGRDLLILDADSVSDNAEFLNTIRDYCTPGYRGHYAGLGQWGRITWLIYTTMSSTHAAPRYRIIIPLDRTATADEYKKIARVMMTELGEKNFDMTASYTPWHHMILPVKSPSTSDFSCEVVPGEPLSVDWALEYISLTEATDDEEVKNDANIVVKEEKIHAPQPKTTRSLPVGQGYYKKGKKSGQYADFEDYPEGDPRNKNSIVGSFCKAFSISEAIEEFDLPYEEAGVDTYLYTESETGCPGAHVKDDDLFFYSYHSEDPACIECRGCDINAYDLVRIHKGLDFSSMYAFAMSQPAVMRYETERRERNKNYYKNF